MKHRMSVTLNWCNKKTWIFIKRHPTLHKYGCAPTTYDADALQVGEDMIVDNNLLLAWSFQQAKSSGISLQQEDLAGKAIEKALKILNAIKRSETNVPPDL